VWDAPEFDGGSPITGYVVEKLAGTRWIKASKQSLTQREFAVKDLIEGSDCEYRVLAENKAGQSKPSETTGRFIAKNPFEEPGKPEPPVVDEVKETSVALSWQPPKSDGGSPITNYIVEYRRKGDMKWNTATREAKTTEFTVEDLVPETEYEFRVTAQNKAGAGPPSAPSNVAKYGEYGQTESNVFLNSFFCS
jgi:titin